MPSRPILLFSYGTLQDKSVQIANFGRELIGRKDVLPGFVRGTVPIADQEINSSSGGAYYANAELSANPQDAISGMVFEVTEDDLGAADEYENPANYHRILVTLGSGDQAWVYVCG
jgi:hypothetical protein